MSAARGSLRAIEPYRPSKRDLAYEEALLNASAWQSERPFVLELLTAMREARTADDLMRVQARLVGRMKGREVFIANSRAKLAETKRELSETVRGAPKPLDKIRDLQALKASQEAQDRLESCQNHVLRVLGDELAWRAYSANRAAITVLGQGQPVCWLSDGAGWDAELNAVQQVWETDHALALIHDATNCLRVGDLSCFFPDRVEVREVKASHTPTESTVQMSRIRDATDLINNGRTTIDEIEHVLLRAPVEYRTHLADLPDVLARAHSAGRAMAKLSSAHFVVAHDFGHPEAAGFGPFGAEHARANARWADSDVILNFGTSLRRMRDRRHDFAYFAPLSLLPIDPHDIVDLLYGALDFTTWLNVSAVGRYLAGRGWHAEPHTMPMAAERFLTLSKRSGRGELQLIGLAPHLREMMCIELMTTPTLASLVEHMFAEAQRDPSLLEAQPLIVAGDERATWDLMTP